MVYKIDLGARAEAAKVQQKKRLSQPSRKNFDDIIF